MCYAIIGSEGDFFFLIEKHQDIKMANERSQIYFNAAFQPPFNDALLENEFSRMTPIGEGDYLRRREQEQSSISNELGEVIVVKD